MPPSAQCPLAAVKAKMLDLRELPTFKGKADDVSR
jgi:hypothetical protein